MTASTVFLAMEPWSVSPRSPSVTAKRKYGKEGLSQSDAFGLRQEWSTYDEVLDTRSGSSAASMESAQSKERLQCYCRGQRSAAADPSWVRGTLVLIAPVRGEQMRQCYDFV